MAKRKFSKVELETLEKYRMSPWCDLTELGSEMGRNPLSVEKKIEDLGGIVELSKESSDHVPPPVNSHVRSQFARKPGILVMTEQASQACDEVKIPVKNKHENCVFTGNKPSSGLDPNSLPRF